MPSYYQSWSDSQQETDNTLKSSTARTSDNQLLADNPATNSSSRDIVDEDYESAQPPNGERRESGEISSAVGSTSRLSSWPKVSWSRAILLYIWAHCNETGFISLRQLKLASDEIYEIVKISELNQRAGRTSIPVWRLDQILVNELRSLARTRYHHLRLRNEESKPLNSRASLVLVQLGNYGYRLLYPPTKDEPRRQIYHFLLTFGQPPEQWMTFFSQLTLTLYHWQMMCEESAISEYEIQLELMTAGYQKWGLLTSYDNEESIDDEESIADR